MSVERIGGGYVKISVKQEDLEESIDALSDLMPVLQALVIRSNGADKRQAAIDAREIGKNFDTAISAMMMLLSGFNEYKEDDKNG